MGEARAKTLAIQKGLWAVIVSRSIINATKDGMTTQLDPLFKPPDLTRELYTPIVCSMLYPEELVENELSATQRTIDGSNQLMIDALVARYETNPYFADIATDLKSIVTATKTLTSAVIDLESSLASDATAYKDAVRLDLAVGEAVANTSLDAAASISKSEATGGVRVILSGLPSIVDGQPMAGVTLYLRTENATTDEDGRAYLEERSCGLEHVRYLSTYAATIEVYSGETADLVRDGLREAEVMLVDPYGTPADTSLRAPAGDIDRAGVGHYIVRSTVARLTVSWDTGHQKVNLEQPLTLVVAHPEEMVTVDVIGPEPERLTCNSGPCTRSGTWACACRTATMVRLQARLPGQQMPYRHVIEHDTDHVSWDLRMSTLHGQWTGMLPCDAFGTSIDGNHTFAPCERGRFGLTLPPGIWTIPVDNPAKEVASIVLDVRRNDVIDIGEPYPEAISIEGRIIADFPLDSAQLIVMQGGRAELLGDGQVFIQSAASGRLMLLLQHGTCGQFVHFINVADAPFTWTVSANECEQTGACDGPWTILGSEDCDESEADQDSVDCR